VFPVDSRAMEARSSDINLARPLGRVGFIIGLALLAGVVVDGVLRESQDWLSGLRWAAAYAAVGIVLLWTTGALVGVVFLRGRLRREIARGNLAAGLVAGGNFVAVGWILESCFFGRDLRSLTVSACFFLVGVAALIALQLLYRGLTRYADDQEVMGENVASALSYVGVTLALAIVVAHAASGPFLGWRASLRAFAVALLLTLALYPVRQLVVARLLLGLPARLRGGALDRMIAQERSVAVGSIEALAYVGTALLATALG